ncbi:MAG: hypothetical protein OXI43_12645 [Candidatus Poribacteria bacterium]|nr:hypothetical protein [Candidatus Poribacteria bacterium]
MCFEKSFLTGYLERQIRRVIHAWTKGRLSEFDAKIECCDLILAYSPRGQVFDWEDYVLALMRLFKTQNSRTRLCNDSHVGCK